MALRCAPLCHRLVKACTKMQSLGLNANFETIRDVLNGLKETDLNLPIYGNRQQIHLKVPGRCRRSLTGVTAARLSCPESLQPASPDRSYRSPPLLTGVTATRLP